MMSLVFVVAGLAIMLVIDSLVARGSRNRHKGLVRMLTVPAAAAPKPKTKVTFYDAERQLTAQLRTGVLSPADYRDAVAALAASDQRVTGVNPLLLITLGHESLDRLNAEMPAVPRSTLFAAIALAQNGATVDTLMRLLGLTNAQAVKVIITTAGSGRV